MEDINLLIKELTPEKLKELEVKAKQLLEEQESEEGYWWRAPRNRVCR